MATHMLKKWTDEALKRIPNNTISLGEPPDGVRDIIRGTTPEHFISVPFNLTKDVRNIQIIYKQGVINTVIKTYKDINVDSRYPHIGYYQFTEEETLKFKAIPNEPVKVQVRTELMNWDVVTSDIKLINVLETLSDITLSCEMNGVSNITQGLSATHYIFIPYDVKELSDIQIQYSQKYGNSVVKDINDITIAKDSHTCYFTLSAEETSLFEETTLDLNKCDVRVKIQFKNGVILNGESHVIDVLSRDNSKMFK